MVNGAPISFEEAVALAGGGQQAAPRARVRFYEDYIYDEERSFIEGVPRFDVVIKVEIIRPGSTTVRRAIATEEHKRKYRAEWNAFVEKHEVAQQGTPIENMVWLSGDRIMSLKGWGYTTIERLAEMPVNDAQRLGPGMVRAVTQAKRILQGDGAELRELRAEVVDLQRQLNAMQGRLFQAGQPQPQVEQRPRLIL